MNRSDSKIHKAVVDGLKLQPGLDAEGIVVDVEQGVVTLSGYVHCLADKNTAKQVVKGVYGVKAIAFNLCVLGSTYDIDTQIATEIADLLTYDTALSKEHIQAMVDDAWVTLEGEVDDHCQKVAAFNKVSSIESIKGISNRIIVKL